MKNDLISIIVPVYNVEKYLEKCINSILNQTYKNIEIILIDDGSTDNSGKICDDFSLRFKNIFAFHKINGGSSSARNYGIKKANGNYIMFVDSDDWIDNDMVEFLYNNLKENNCDISISGRYINYENGVQIISSARNEKFVFTPEQAVIALNSYQHFDSSACDRMFNINLFDDIEFPVGKKCEDIYVMYKLLLKSKRTVYWSLPKYHYFQRPNSVSRNNNFEDYLIKATKSQIDYFEENYPNLLYVAYTTFFFANIGSYNKIIKNKISVDTVIINDIKTNCDKYLKYVLNNKSIKIQKRIQAFIFCKFNYLYKFIILLKK